MIQRPPDMGAFQFVVLATLRVSQLMRGCRPRVQGDHKATVIAQSEVAQGKVTQGTNVSVNVGASSPAPVESPPVVVQLT
jgi:DNA-directed RNA polymerase subunit K/omega